MATGLGGKKNSAFKPVKLCLKIDHVPQSAHAKRLDKCIHDFKKKKKKKKLNPTWTQNPQIIIHLWNWGGNRFIL